jgi:hypothetical protein
MPTRIIRGSFAHVAGTFNLSDRSGTIDYVTPVKTATESADLENEGIHLIGEDQRQRQLFDRIVNPQRNSCAPHAEKGTFEEFVPVSPELHKIRLTIHGGTAAEFVRGQKTALAPMSLGAPDPNAPHKMPLVVPPGTGARPGITYSVQAKADNAPWQTLAVGLAMPTAHVDVNQFPGAKKVEIRVLQSDGFSETEVFRDDKTF